MRIRGSQKTGPWRATRARALALASCLVAPLVLLVTSLALAEESGRAVPTDLLQKAWTKGTLRVIVELGGVGALPEGRLLSQAAVAAQRGRIVSDRAALRFALRGLRHRVLREFKTIPYVGLEVDHDTLRVLDALPGLATRVHEDILLRPMLAQSGPLIKAPDAWNAGWDGTGQVVAIIDTGVDKTHPFLAGKVVEEACYDSSGVSTCPNGSTEQIGPGAGAPCTFAPNDCGHGTHVAGIAAGNGSSFDGVARGANLMAVQVFHREDDPSVCAPDPAPCALSSSMDIVAALEHVYDLRGSHAFAAANLSLGGGWSTSPCDGVMPDMDAAIANLRSAHIATAVASGNDGFLNALSYPACISTAVSVGATSDGSGGFAADVIMSFSNSAPFLSLLAPGYLINSSVPGSGFANAAGTSMAAPHAAGAWAVMKQAKPDASVDEILAGLVNTGKRITDVNVVTTSRIAFTVLQFSASAYSVTESAGVATITVTRSGAMFGPNLAPLTVDYATSADTAISGQDYTETSGSLTFDPGQTSRTFTVPIVNDTTMDGQRKVNLTLTNPGGGALLGARDTAVLTIGDNDVAGSIQFSVSAYSAGEQAGIATITVTRSGGSASDVTVQYTTGDGTGHAGVDYQPATGMLTFASSGPGATTQTFDVTIWPNGLPDGNRTVNLTLHTPGGGAVLGARKTAVLTIVDDEIVLQFSQASYSATEGGASATITVTRSGPAAAVDVTYTVVPGSATPGADYGGVYSGVLAFAANQTNRTFTVSIVNDTLAEEPETVLLQLSSPTNGALLGARQTAVLTILDNDNGGVFRFSAPSYSVKEGTSSATITVTRSGGGAGNVSIDVAVVGGTATAGTDFTIPDALVPDTLVRLTFASGQTSQSFPIAVTNDSDVESDEAVLLALQNPQGGGALGSPAAATLTIVDNDRAGTFQFSAATYSVDESGPAVILTVTRLGSTTGAGSLQVWFQDDTAVAGACGGGPDYAPAANPQALDFPSGWSSAMVSVPICANTAVDGNRAFKAQLGNPSPPSLALGTIPEATVRILDDDGTVRLGAAQVTVSEGASSVSVSVIRTGGTSQPVVVSYVAAGAGVGPGFATPAALPTACGPGADFRPVAGTVTLSAGQTSNTLLVPLCGDSLAGEGDEAFTVSLTGIVSGPATLGTPASTTVVIQENDGPLVRLGASTYTASEGSAGVAITVKRSGSLSSPASVELIAAAVTALSATGDDGCGSGADFIASTQVVSFAAGQSSKTATVAFCDDTLAEGPEDFRVWLQNPVGAALGSPVLATVSLTDNELGGTLQWSVADASGVEGTTLVLTVARAGGLASDVTVQVTTHDGGADTPGADALAGVDYDPLPPTTLTFDEGILSQTVEIPLLARDGAQGPRAFRVTLHDAAGQAALGSPSTATVWILDPS